MRLVPQCLLSGEKQTNKSNIYLSDHLSPQEISDATDMTYLIISHPLLKKDMPSANMSSPGS